jgi:diacylglycerol kinase
MLKKHAVSISYAWNGLIWAVRTQNNYKAHITLIFLSVGGGLFFNINYAEWLVILALSIMGLIIETLNTAIERLGDAITLNYNEHIKIAKDVSAAAMLIYASGAIIMAGVIFLPKFIAFFVR